MATLTPTLTLTGTAADFGAALSLSQSDTLIVGAPFSGVSRISIATSEQDVSSDLTTSQTAHTFVYLRNIDTSNIITIATGATTGIPFATLNPEEFMFLPLKGTVGLKATANNAPCVLEYAYFTRS